MELDLRVVGWLFNTSEVQEARRKWRWWAKLLSRQLKHYPLSSKNL
jgi:hypothetical protein